MTVANKAGDPNPTDTDTVPSRGQWPEPLAQTEAGRVLTEVILTTFVLNDRLMEAAQRLGAAGGLTAAWWQVLGGVLDQPRTVAEIGRRMGMTRQGVQRVANLLADRGLAEYRPNPAHRRAKLLACTEAGYWAIRRIALVQHPWSNRIGAELGVDKLTDALATMQRLVATLEADPDDLADSDLRPSAPSGLRPDPLSARHKGAPTP